MSKLKHKFNRIVCYFDQAIHLARLSPLAAALVYEARVASWAEATRQGLSNPIPFRFSLKALARKYECDRNALRKQLDYLTVARILIPTVDGRFLINKDYRDWIDPSSFGPLFNAHRLAILDDLRRYSGGCVETPPRYNPETLDTPRGVCGDTPKGCPATPLLAPPPAPPYYPPPEDRLDRRKMGGVAHAREPLAGGNGEAPRPPKPASTKAEIRALIDWADRHCHDRSRWASDQAEEFPASWVQSVLSRHVVAERQPKGPAYLQKILIKWEKAGFCEYLDTSSVPSIPISPRLSRAERLIAEARREAEEAERAAQGGEHAR